VRDGVLVRYNPSTDHYGVLDQAGYILTYFKLSLAWHTHPSNLAYFRADCERRT
jgi:hypothetical protein